MLVPLRGVNKCNSFPMKSVISILLLFVKGALVSPNKNKEANVYKNPQGTSSQQQMPVHIKNHKRQIRHILSARRWLSNNLLLLICSFIKPYDRNFRFFKIKS